MERVAIKGDKRILTGIWVFTVIVYALVVFLHELPQASSAPGFVPYQPLLHATINGTCFLLLLASLFAIRKRQVELHKKLNTAAMFLSLIFLLSYVVHHYFAGDTSYGGDFKSLFYFVLITHILLAGLSLPFILLAYYRGLIGDYQRHRKLVKFVFPVWVYVTFTGVLVYLFLAPYYS